MQSQHRYLEIASVMRHRILSGDWPVGFKLPPITALKDEFGVAGINTVRAAQRVLQDEGLILPRHGSGVYVIGSSATAGLAAELSGVRDRLTAVLHSLPHHLTSPVVAGPQDLHVLTEALRWYSAALRKVSPDGRPDHESGQDVQLADIADEIIRRISKNARPVDSKV